MVSNLERTSLKTKASLFRSELIQPKIMILFIAISDRNLNKFIIKFLKEMINKFSDKI